MAPMLEKEMFRQLSVDKKNNGGDVNTFNFVRKGEKIAYDGETVPPDQIAEDNGLNNPDDSGKLDLKTENWRAVWILYGFNPTSNLKEFNIPKRFTTQDLLEEMADLKCTGGVYRIE